MHPAKTSRDMCRILIVDDAPSVRESLEWLIEDEPGLTVIGSASNGTEALQQTVNLKPDLIILDIELPDVDGFHVTRQLKAMPLSPIVVLLSVHSDAQSRKHGFESGCDAYVEKALGWPGLLSVIQNVLAGRDSQFP